MPLFSFPSQPRHNATPPPSNIAHVPAPPPPPHTQLRTPNTRHCSTPTTTENPTQSEQRPAHPLAWPEMNEGMTSRDPHQRTARKRAPTTDHHAAYLVRDRTFAQQFSACYQARLAALHAAVVARLTPAEAASQTRVADLRDGGTTQTLVGTTVKVARRLPNLLAEYAAQRALTGFRWDAATSYADPADEVFLEDASGRVRVAFEGDDSDWAAAAVAHTASGSVVGLVGTYDAPRNVFVVAAPDNIVAPACRGTGLATASDDGESGCGRGGAAPVDGRYVAIVSGLCVGSGGGAALAQTAAAWLAGNVGGADERRLAASVVRVVVAGNSVVCPEARSETVTAESVSAARRSTELFAADVLELEDVLTTVAASCPVDVMPGFRDPANCALPQQPMESLLFPTAAPFESFQLVTNPHTVSVGGTVFTGTSGENIDNLAAMTCGLSRLDLLQRTYELRHMAPTAPDTLGCFPTADRDRLLLGAGDVPLPDVYFAGNQPEFATRLVSDPTRGALVRLVLVPDFSKTGTLVLVDIDTRKTYTMTFMV